MYMTWLGQAGLLLEVAGKTVLIDPYLSDSVAKVNPQNTRRIPVDSRFLDLQPDVLIFTHDHLDHYDPETAPVYLERLPAMTVLAPGTCWQKARVCGKAHNCVLFDSGTQWTQGDIRFTAVPAVHSDPAAIGVFIQAEGRSLYVTGDTLYSRNVLDALPEAPEIVFLPINGVGNNMNPVDAARFAQDCGAKVAVPVHWGLFDGLDPGEFPFEEKIIPEIYIRRSI